MKIMWKDKEVAWINEKNGAVKITGTLPYDLYLEEDSGTNFDICMSNYSNFISWCAGRVLPLDREHAKAILNSCGFSQGTTDKERSKIAQTYHCLTLTDSFWTKQDDEPLDWNNINLFENSLDNTVVDISLLGRSLTITNTDLIAPDCSTPGVFPKAWVRECNETYLYKGERQETDSVRKEVEASSILKDLGIPALSYTYDEWNGNKVSKCKLFTNPDISFATAENYQFNNSFPALVKENPKYLLSFHLMNLADYLVGNTDRHWGNWGLLYDESGIRNFAPLMDFNHSFESEEKTHCLPYILFSEKTTQNETANYALEYLKKEYPQICKQLLKNMEIFYWQESKYHYADYTKEKIASLNLEKIVSVNTKEMQGMHEEERD